VSRGAITEALDLLRKKGIDARTVDWKGRTLLVARTNPAPKDLDELQETELVERLVLPTLTAQLASREFQKGTSVVKVGTVDIGAGRLVIIAGPCSVEGREQLLKIAHAAKQLGASLLRGGVFKPRTSPYEFQGLGEAGLRLRT